MPHTKSTSPLAGVTAIDIIWKINEQAFLNICQMFDGFEKSSLEYML